MSAGKWRIVAKDMNAGNRRNAANGCSAGKRRSVDKRTSASNERSASKGGVQVRGGMQVMGEVQKGRLQNSNIIVVFSWVFNFHNGFQMKIEPMGIEFYKQTQNLKLIRPHFIKKLWLKIYLLQNKAY